jgi:phthalate 4,5-dioxygenase oxygenase subunit
MNHRPRTEMDRSMTDPFAKLTQVGPGSPTGEFFRQFWLPFLRVRGRWCPEPPDGAGRAPRRLPRQRRRMGIFDHRCPHRCASLFFGRNENGLRCSYQRRHYIQ